MLLHFVRLMHDEVSRSYLARVKHPIGTNTHRIMDAIERMARLASLPRPGSATA